MAEALIKEYDIIVTNDLSFEFLELFAKYSADFDLIKYNYYNMTSKEFMPIFHFLENNGCTFQKISTYYSYVWNYNSRPYKKIFYLKSPIYDNITQSTYDKYDVNTLLFLMKYAKNEDLIYSNYHDRNIIDVLISFKCFDSILEIYKKLNRVLYPLQKSIQLKELIEVLDNFEEEEINEKEIKQGYYY